MTDRSYDAVTRDRLVAVETSSYEVGDFPYRVIRCYWASGRVTFKDTGLDGEWHLGDAVPTPDALLAQPFADMPAPIADAPRHSAD